MIEIEVRVLLSEHPLFIENAKRNIQDVNDFLPYGMKLVGNPEKDKMVLFATKSFPKEATIGLVQGFFKLLNLKLKEEFGFTVIENRLKLNLHD